MNAAQTQDSRNLDWAKCRFCDVVGKRNAISRHEALFHPNGRNFVEPTEEERQAKLQAKKAARDKKKWTVKPHGAAASQGQQLPAANAAAELPPPPPPPAGNAAAVGHGQQPPQAPPPPEDGDAGDIAGAV